MSSNKADWESIDLEESGDVMTPEMIEDGEIDETEKKYHCTSDSVDAN